MNRETLKRISDRITKLERTRPQAVQEEDGSWGLVWQGSRLPLVGGGEGLESDPIALAALALHEAKDRDDNVHGLDTYLDAIDAAISAKQDASTAATDAELTTHAALNRSNNAHGIDTELDVIDAALTKLINAPSALAYNSVAQTLTTAIPAFVALDSERWDNDTIHHLTTNNHRLTCKTAGVYLVTGAIEILAHATGSRTLFIYRNTTDVIAEDYSDPVASAGNTTLLQATTHVKLAVNDWVEMVAVQTSGGNLNINPGGHYSPELSMTRLSDG